MIARRLALAVSASLCVLTGALMLSGASALASGAAIDAQWVADVAATSATLSAQVNPNGSDTTYRFEYGQTASYGHNAPIPDGDAGSGIGDVPLSMRLQDLSAGTTYHYRIVVHNALGTVEGADRMFTTQTAGGELTLLDGREWELVSPPTKNGGLIEPREQGWTVTQSSEDGGAFTYLSNVPLGSGVVGNTLVSQILSTRGSGGWSSQDLESPHEKPVGLATADGEGDIQEYPFFSSDLSSAIAEPAEAEGEAPLSSETTEPTVYLRDNANGAYRALVTPADVPTNTKYGYRQRRVEFLDATPDASHAILGSPEALTLDAKQVEPAQTTSAASQNLYEWADGKLQLVNILPGGEATEGGASVGRRGGIVARAVSDDGRRVVWDHLVGGSSDFLLYVRDMTRGVTVQLGGPNALFQTAGTDGSKIFFNEVPATNESYDFTGDLMVYDASTGLQTDLTITLNPGERAGVQSGLMGASEDGSYVYFVATGVLTTGATSGEDNLYLSHDTGAGWQTTFIATLSKEDERSWVNQQRDAWSLTQVSSRVSPDGRYVAFMSERSLTGYDNTDAVSGQPDEEVYLYDAANGRLVCASCDPTGARPVGVLDRSPGPENSLLVDRPGAWTARQGTGDHWLAGSIPGWAPGLNGESGFYQPRYLSDNGRLLFNSPVGLVPQDTNGLEDVYEYEPAGVGSCTSTSATFDKRSGGCVDLLTSGTSSDESVLFDASVTGNDAFVLTASSLASEDYDTSYDVYDAHVCSVASPCVSARVSPPACTTADSCKPAPAPQPTSFGAPASATFSGTGDVETVVSKPVTKKLKVKAKRHMKRTRKGRKSSSRRGRRGWKRSNTKRTYR
jgi:hypothetical protein